MAEIAPGRVALWQALEDEFPGQLERILSGIEDKGLGSRRKLVKFRYQCSGLAPVVVFHLVGGSGGVDPAYFAAWVGEGSVFS